VNKRTVVWLVLAVALAVASLSLPLWSGKTAKAVLCGIQILATIGCLRQTFIFMACGAQTYAAVAFAAALIAGTAAGVTLFHLL
jgi:hypothetical protein